MVIFVCFSASNTESFEFDHLEMQESQVWNVAKNAAAAAAISLVLSASPVQAREGNAFLKFPDNSAGEAVSTDFLMHMDGVKAVHS